MEFSMALPRSRTCQRKDFRWLAALPGFTLVELLVVIAIVGVLVAAVAAGHPGGTRKHSTQCML